MRFSDYERLIFLKGSKNYHITPWGESSIVVRNVNDEGKVVTFKDPQEQRKSKYRMWVKCQLVVLRGQSNQIFPVYQCEECEEMEFVSSLNINQDQNRVEGYKCAHSKERLQNINLMVREPAKVEIKKMTIRPFYA